jgi:hypothetical protein
MVNLNGYDRNRVASELNKKYHEGKNVRSRMAVQQTIMRMRISLEAKVDGDN